MATENINIQSSIGETDFVFQRGIERVITLDKEEIYLYVGMIVNPNGDQLVCTVESGEGMVALYKNNRWIGYPYLISANQEEYPITIRLNTLAMISEDGERTIEFDREKLAEQYHVPQKQITHKFLRERLARQYSVRKSEIVFPKPGDEQKIDIPDSIWDVYIAPSGSQKNVFRLKLCPRTD